MALRPFMRIVLDEMPEDPDPITPGAQGTIVDADEYQVLVDWDEQVGRSLHLIPGVDKYHVIDPGSEPEMERSWENLGRIQDRLRGRDREDSRCPRCGQYFDLRRGAVSRRITVTNISVCDRCGQQEAIEDFVLHGAEMGVSVDVTVPAGRNHTGYESEPYDEPTVSTNLDSHKRSDSLDDIDKDDSYDSANKLRAAEGEEEKKEKLKIDVLPLSDWYIVKIWTGRFEEVAG